VRPSGAQTRRAQHLWLVPFAAGSLYELDEMCILIRARHAKRVWGVG